MSNARARKKLESHLTEVTERSKHIRRVLRKKELPEGADLARAVGYLEKAVALLAQGEASAECW
jgi:hypothetical protein